MHTIFTMNTNNENLSNCFMNFMVVIVNGLRHL